MKIPPINRTQNQSSAKVSKNIVDAMTSVRDCVHHTFSDKTALGRITNKHPRASVIAALTLLTGLIIGGINLVKPSDKNASKSFVDKTAEFFDANFIKPIKDDLKATERALNNW